MNDIARLRQQLLATAMVAGSLCVWAGHLGSLDSTETPARYVAQIATHHTQFVFGELLIAIGAFLLIPAMAGLMHLTPARGGRFTTIGGSLAGVALAGLGAGNLMFGVVLGMLTPTHNDLATELVRIANSAPLAGVPFIPAPLLTIGLILVGVGLLRAGAVPKALAVALIAGGVLVVPSGGGGPITVALLAPMCLSIVALGAILARRTHIRSEAVVPGPTVSV